MNVKFQKKRFEQGFRKTVTASACRVTLPRSKGKDLLDYKIKQKSEKCVTINGTEYGVADNIALHESVANGTQTMVDTGVNCSDDMEFFCRLECNTLDSFYLLQRRSILNPSINGLTGSNSGAKISLGFCGQNVVSNITRTIGHIYAIKGTVLNGTLTLYVKDETTGTEDTKTGTYTVGTLPTDNVTMFGNAKNDSLASGNVVYEAYIKKNGSYAWYIIGDYDVIGKSVITATRGTLTAGKTTKTVNAHSQIPSEYTELSYLGLASNAYFSSGVHANPSTTNSRLKVLMTYLSGTTALYGTRGTTSSSTKSYNIFGAVSGSNGRFDNVNPSLSYGFTADTWYDIALGHEGLKGTVKVNDGTLYTGAQNMANEDVGEILIGTLNNVDTPFTGGTPSQWAYVEIAADGTTVDLKGYPVKRNSDDVVGFYNTIDGTFITPTSGTATAGSPNQIEVPLFKYRGVGDYGGKRNQLVRNGNFESKSGWSNDNVDFTVANNIATIVSRYSLSGIYQIFRDVLPGHKVLFSLDVKTTGTGHMETLLSSDIYFNNDGVWHNYSTIDVVGESGLCAMSIKASSGIAYAQNSYVVDLTDTFGAGNEPTTVAEAKQRIAEVWNGGTPLPYYPYTEPTDYYDRHIVTATGGMVDMGTLNWNPIGNGAFYVAIYDKANGRNIYCQKYPTDQTTMASATANMHIGGHSGNRVYFKNTNIENTRQAAQEDLQGVTLFYQRDTDDSFSVNHYHVYTDEQGFSCGDVADEVSFLGGDVLNVGCKVFDGTEVWTDSGIRYYIPIAGRKNGSGVLLTCSHPFNLYAYATVNVGFTKTEMPSSVTDVDTWKAYLAAQYANGTPIKVWYPLATPVTKQIAAPRIPTVIGDAHFEVLTETAPSEVMLIGRSGVA